MIKVNFYSSALKKLLLQRTNSEKTIAIRLSPPRVLSPEEVERKARHAVLARGGNLNNRMEVLGEFSLQKFQYRGRSFKWALENDPAYVSYLI